MSCTWLQLLLDEAVELRLDHLLSLEAGDRSLLPVVLLVIDGQGDLLLQLPLQVRLALLDQLLRLGEFREDLGIGGRRGRAGGGWAAAEELLHHLACLL